MFGKSLQERGKNLENYLYYSDPFFAYNNSLYIEKTINGKPVNITLSNFLARIPEDIPAPTEPRTKDSFLLSVQMIRERTLEKSQYP